MSGHILITGGTGNTGRRIAARLGELGVSARVASRAASGSDHVVFDWADPSTHAPALSGVDRVYLIAPGMVEDPSTLMLPFLERALASGVGRFVLLSSSAIPEGAPGLGTVDRFLRERAPGFAILKPSWFMQNFVEPRHPHAASLIGEGKVVTSTGAGRVGFVDADDIAEVAVRALVDETSHDTAHVITGPEALTYAEVAAILERVTGRPMRHEHVDDDEARRRLTAAGMPEPYAALLVGLDIAIRDGAEDRVTDTVLRVTGRAPRSFEAFARAHARVFRG
ncbi:NmrA family NAD(P)-binding protein [Polyangium jinanense]|uniref:NAD(P)H-binding protein n=1 Tax=Polyangium jinanense TaxID=2829994 RepID=A0A9X3XGX4_9BACT|nr:NAD(P)H-binding protein [Polyangium jinanense]MDC3961450.1 NAD(P)H-binding protein [Polyangium jinanense]MDC3987881.1 NAD(P)H-binding protein [Polyangium jinanense]